MEANLLKTADWAERACRSMHDVKTCTAGRDGVCLPADVLVVSLAALCDS